MKGRYLHIILALCLALAGLSTVLGQSYEEKRQEILQKQENTRTKINELDARIRSYQKRLEEIDEEYDESYKKYENYNSLIALQDDKIKGLEEAKHQLESEIALTRSEIDKRESELEYLIDNYKKILLYTYKNSNISNLELILTSDSFNQMILRSFYLGKFEKFKVDQAKQIQEQQKRLDNAQANLTESLEKNNAVLSEINHEKSNLAQQRNEQKKTVDTIKTQRTTIAGELNKNREQKEQLENTFEELINEEIAMQKAEAERLRKLAEAEKITDIEERDAEIARYSVPSVMERSVTDEMMSQFGSSFASKKGKLRWPVNSNTVSKKFGKTRNPIYGTMTEHLGINIVTDPGTEVFAVSDGYVFTISPITGFGDVVFMNHGGYYTAYGNLGRIDVLKNQVVREGERIGLSGGTKSPLGENIFFMVRKERTNLNPQDWLIKN